MIAEEKAVLLISAAHVLRTYRTRLTREMTCRSHAAVCDHPFDQVVGATIFRVVVLGVTNGILCLPLLSTDTIFSLCLPLAFDSCNSHLLFPFFLFLLAFLLLVLLETLLPSF
jgi:hypothetical protein